MAIKYHDNIKGRIEGQYGADHKLTDNWNPYKVYGEKEYVNVCFIIECFEYVYDNCNNVHWSDNAGRELFYNEVSVSLGSIGWNVDMCDATKEKAHLYIHPQIISGEVLKNDVKTIAEKLENNRTFSIRWVDLHETVLDITDEEYTARLETKKEEIKSKLLKICATSRTTTYRYTTQVAKAIANEVRTVRINDNDGRNYGVDFTANYIISVIDELVNAGYLVRIERNGYDLIRTINKTEQKKLKLKIA